MIIYGHNQDQDVEGIEEVEFQHLGHQLVNFVTTYRTLIRIDPSDPDVEPMLNSLYDIGMKIINKQYHLLFNDPSIVIPNFQQTTLAEYQSELFSEYPYS